MFKRLSLFLVLCLVHPATSFAAEAAPSKPAAELRASGDLIPYAPPKSLLEAYFIADEAQPVSVWGPVSAYVQSRSCSTAWLIEKGEQARVERLSAVKDAPPFEFSVTLEEDCPGRVTHAVFVVAPGATPEAWFKWRRQFHGSKAQGYYAEAEAGLMRAEAAHRLPTAELRFLLVNGELSVDGPEQALAAEGRLKPVFGLKAK